MAAPAAAAPAPKALPPAAVIRIPESATRPTLTIDVNAPVVRGEFASSVRIPSDRADLHARIERQRAVEAASFARGAGPGISVRLRRSKY
jgi:hypothetical protein